MSNLISWKISEQPTFVAVLETEVLVTLAKRAAFLYRTYAIICGLVVECPICQEYTLGIRVAALIDIIAVFWLNVRVDDVLKASC